MVNINTDKEKIEYFLARGIENVYPSKGDVVKRLKSGKKLTMYLGIDATGPTLHMGHIVILRKLQQYQTLGHKVILLIGDFTSMIGDPTDKSATRISLTHEEVMKNAELYKEQASKFISFDGDNPAELKYNNDWLGKLTFKDVIDVSTYFTVQQLLERDMFQKRIEESKPIHLHEFMYPLMQAYDSVHMDVDGEIGGNDQTFNMLAGRTLMKSMKQKDKFVITMKLLVDPTGKKMGKSEGNMITMQDNADELFGKVMSWTDGMILPGFEILTDVSTKQIATFDQEIKDGRNPREVKVELAKEVVKLLFDEKDADNAAENFDKLFQAHEVPEDIPIHEVIGDVNIIDVLTECGLAKSKSEARRLIDGKGVKVDDQVVEGYEHTISPSSEGVVIQKGKRHFIRVVKK